MAERDARLGAIPPDDIHALPYIMENAMQVGRWGNSLAIRLPSAVVEALQLREGDEITVEVADKRTFRIERDKRREEAFAQLDALAVPLPPGFRFSRDEANARGNDET